MYGGGRGRWGPQSGYDCSGFVSAGLHAGGYMSQPVDTMALPQPPGMEPGPGQYVTVYDWALAGQSGHVIIEIKGQCYESGGSPGAWGGGAGVEQIGTPRAACLAQFPKVLQCTQPVCNDRTQAERRTGNTCCSTADRVLTLTWR